MRSPVVRRSRRETRKYFDSADWAMGLANRPLPTQVYKKPDETLPDPRALAVKQRIEKNGHTRQYWDSADSWGKYAPTLPRVPVFDRKN